MIQSEPPGCLFPLQTRDNSALCFLIKGSSWNIYLIRISAHSTWCNRSVSLWANIGPFHVESFKCRDELSQRRWHFNQSEHKKPIVTVRPHEGHSFAEAPLAITFNGYILMIRLHVRSGWYFMYTHTFCSRPFIPLTCPVFIRSFSEIIPIRLSLW